MNRGASLPGPGDVVRGRFVAPVALDAGTLEVVPAPAGDRPHVSAGAGGAGDLGQPRAAEPHPGAARLRIGDHLAPGQRSAARHEAARLGRIRQVVGDGELSGGIARARPRPRTGLSGKDLPSSGYAVVVIGAGHGSPAVTYTAPSLFCGSVQPAALALATEVVSVPWQAVTGVENQSLEVRASLPACGRLEGISSGGSAKVTTVTVAAVVPDAHGRCDGTSDHHPDGRAGTGRQPARCTTPAGHGVHRHPARSPRPDEAGGRPCCVLVRGIPAKSPVRRGARYRVAPHGGRHTR